MKDAIIKSLNTRLANKISNTRPGGQQAGVESVSKFDQVLQNKQNEKTQFNEKFTEVFLDANKQDKDMEVLSADNIKINIQQGEFVNQSTFNGKNAITELFSTINNDALKMDSIIEVLASDNTRLSRRQMLAYQASIGTLTINTEMFSKLAQSISQNINTLLQTNMG